MSDTADIKEGFLCPICMKDFGTVSQLQDHFEQAHSSEDKAVFQQLKGFFDKAKRKILGDKEEGYATGGDGQRGDNSFFNTGSGLSGYDPSWWEPQELGAVRTHTDTFKAVRDARVDHFVVETNKLLIRLDKLIGPDSPLEPNKRKVLGWADKHKQKEYDTGFHGYTVTDDKIHHSSAGMILNSRKVISSKTKGQTNVTAEGSYGIEHVHPTAVSQSDRSLTAQDIFEKSVVPWIPDSEVPACLCCERSFSLRRRRHHCRVCGGIMCENCSQFLTFSYAQKLVNPAFSFQGEGFLRRSGSNSSLNSLMGPEGERHMRVCNTCRHLLERRDQMTEQRNTKTPLMQLYDKMKSCVQEAEELLPRYLPMVESLSTGEAVYNYRQAQILRTKVVRLYEAVDQLSKKISVLDFDKDPQPNPKQIYLQKAIRLYASNFMQDNLMGLQALPTEEEYKKLQEKRKEEIQRKIAAERLAAMEAQEREKRQEDPPEKQGKSPTDSVKQLLGHKRSDSQDSVSRGWKPTEVIPASDEDDPMLQQIKIIRGYIQQAKKAQRWDEVSMLEQNLKDLQSEYIRQQRGGFMS